MENNDKKIAITNEKKREFLREVDMLKLGFSEEREKYRKSIEEIITSINDIVTHMRNSLDVDLTESNLEVEVYNKIKEMILEVKSFSNYANCSWIEELKSFLSNVLLTFNDIIFNRIHTENEFSEQKSKWQETIDQILISHEEEIRMSKFTLILLEIKINENNEKSIKILNQKVSDLEQDKYNVAKLKDQQVDNLSKENNKRLNVNLLKSAIIQMLTTDDISVRYYYINQDTRHSVARDFHSSSV